MRISQLILFMSALLAVNPAMANTITAAQEAQKSITSITAQCKIKGPDGKIGILVKKGAGVIIDDSGIFATNLHIIKNMPFIKTKLADGSQHFAQVLKVMPAYDLALLKVDSTKPVNPIEFADPRSIKLHTSVIHAGHSFWLNGTLYAGEIVGLGKNKKNNQLDVFEVNMDLHKGDSGGPVLDKEGKLLGMISAERQDRHNSCYAIPAYRIKQLYDDYLSEMSDEM